MDVNGKRTCEPLQIPVLMKDIGGCIETLGKTQQCFYRPQYEDVVRQGRYQLLSILRKIKEHDCQKPSLASKEDIERDIFMAEIESEFEETKITHLRKEWSQQQQTMAKLQECLYRKCRLLSLHSSYCSSQGSALCAILAVLMENERLVESYLAEPDMYLSSFIKIADGCLFSFMKTYACDVPLEDSTDYRYVLALYTCISHISNLSTGRQFLTKREECQNMLAELIYILPHIKHTTAKTLKLTLLKILHDITIEAEGLNFLRWCSNLPATLNACIIDEYNAEEHKYALEILERLTKEIPNKELLDKLTNTVNTQRLKELSGVKYREVNQIPRKIFQNIRISADKFLLLQETQTDVPRSQSAGRVCKCSSAKVSKKRSAPSPSRIQTRQVIRLPGDHSRARIRVAQKFKPTGGDYASPSAQSSSSSISSTEFSQTESSTSSSPCRSPPERITQSASPLALCATPCRDMFQLSSEGAHPGFRQGQMHQGPSCMCTSRPYFFGERPDNAPFRNPCLSSCTARCRIQEKPPVAPFGSSFYKDSFKTRKRTSKSPSRKKSGGKKPSSSNSPPCDDRSSCGKRSSSKKPASDIKLSYNRSSSGVKPSSSKNPTFGDTPPFSKASSWDFNKPACKDSFKNKEKSTRSSSEGRKTHSLPIKGPRTSSCSSSCIFKKQEAASLPASRSPSKSNAKSWRCVSYKPKPKTSESKLYKLSSSESKRRSICAVSQQRFSCAESKPKSASSDLPYRKPTYATSKKRSWCASSKRSSKSKFEPSSCFKQTKSSIADSKPVTCTSATPVHFKHTPVVSTLPPDLDDTAALPSTSADERKACFCVSHDPDDTYSLPISDDEEEICTCGSISERRLVPWTPENRMVARLSEFDRRVFHRAQNTIRVVSRVDNRAPNKSQKVVTRIKIPGLPFQRLKSSYRRSD